MDLDAIPLETITGSVYQPRLQEDCELRGLMRSIEENGLRVPIIVQPAGAGFHVVCGHRRVKALAGLLKQGKKGLPAGEAAIQSGALTVNALVLGPLPRLEAALTGFIENDERLDLSPYEKAVCFKAFIDEMGISRDDLARRVHVNRETLDYMVAALSSKNLSAKMIGSWKERKLSLAHVATLYRLRKHRERQQELYQMILARQLTARDAEFWCNQLLDSPDKPLADREYDRLEQRLVAVPQLKSYIDNKWLRLGRSSRGERLDLRFESVAELRDVLGRILASLKEAEPS